MFRKCVLRKCVEDANMLERLETCMWTKEPPDFSILAFSCAMQLCLFDWSWVGIWLVKKRDGLCQCNGTCQPLVLHGEELKIYNVSESVVLMLADMHRHLNTCKTHYMESICCVLRGCGHWKGFVFLKK